MILILVNQINFIYIYVEINFGLIYLKKNKIFFQGIDDILIN